MYDLTYQNIQLSITVQVAESEIPARSKSLGSNFLPDYRLGILLLKQGFALHLVFSVLSHTLLSLFTCSNSFSTSLLSFN